MRRAEIDARRESAMPRSPHNGPRFAFAAGTLAKDQYDNTLGGIRLPPIDVPVARYESTTCQLGGITVPFTDAQWTQLQALFADGVCDYRQPGVDQQPTRTWLKYQNRDGAVIYGGQKFSLLNIEGDRAVAKKFVSLFPLPERASA